MNIVHLVSAGVIGGAEKIALQLAASQHEMGNSVEIWFLFNGGPIMVEAERRGLKARNCGMRNGWDMLGALALRRQLSQHRPDVIHVHTFSIGFFVGLMLRKQAVIVQHEHGCISSSDGWRRKLNNIILRRVVHQADAYIAVSEATKRTLIKTLHIRSDAIRMIPNGVDLSLFEPGRDRRGKKRELGIPDSSLIVGSVGRLVKEKGMDNFLQVAAIIHRQLPDVRFVIAGDGPCRPELTSLIDELKLANFVTLLGMRSDVPELLRTFDLFAMTSNRESFGIALVEAMASGVPVLAFGVDGIPEIINEQCGVLVSPGDVEGLASAAISLLRDSARRSMIAGACRRRAEEYGMQASAAQVNRLYWEIAESNRKLAS